jgi:hypothetical protein
MTIQRRFVNALLEAVDPPHSLQQAVKKSHSPQNGLGMLLFPVMADLLKADRRRRA